VKSRNAKQEIRCNPLTIKKKTQCLEAYPGGVGCVYVYGDATKIFFNFLQGDFHG
jgi:hypothetical protein